MGLGKRSDFTLENAADKADFSYDYDKMGSLKYELSKVKEKSTKKGITFGRAHKDYEKAMVTSNLKHYFGRGTDQKHGIGPVELSNATKITKNQSPRLPALTAQRRLSPQGSPVGPGSYNVE